jgi:ethanolamine utilization microcompartment shell protein EutL
MVEQRQAWLGGGAMNTKIGASTAVGAIVVLLAGNTAAHAQLAVQQTLAQIDRTFVCPESLPSDEARNDALKLFLEEVAAVQPTITVKQLTSSLRR